MIQIDPSLRLPTSEELPDSDDTPVDNEDQNFLPNLLDAILHSLWKDRNDWYFGVDMGIYHTTGTNPRTPVIPDGFLSIGVERRKRGKNRPSYVVWEERNQTVPIFVLEMVSHSYGQEYGEKMHIYARLGVLYYLIYNPEFSKRDKHTPFEIYRLTNGEYQLQSGEPFWMPEIGLGIGRKEYKLGIDEREMLCWYDSEGNPYPTPSEMAQQALQELETKQQELEASQQQATELAQLLQQYRQRFGNLPE
ncbi:hypothetical protein C7H19_11355 [Aphanothece hegewaldii CCALA 016]|uniref:Putative restriction endonuclease domain-containing protein n=1 Tax=Aphanothece hegewaldii CCALA 016 TaxID=2107694 RepID=A0A2T1LY41_9CHRO|nr:Uma2 family endonuclease [Aphanothece hegewaldii]PSF37307.1 hypothetical protein C7H19_11355 [Aphanothece hegewaldii CCALA 016]